MKKDVSNQTQAKESKTQKSKEEKSSAKTTKRNSKDIIIIDGHALAYRAHYALISQHLQDKDGNPTETLFGFFRMLAKLLSEHKPHSLLIVFDPATKNFRHRLYKDYKANRKKTPDELKIQIEQIQKLLQELGFAVLVPQDAEADDLIASIVSQKQGSYTNFLLVSGDKDLFALLSPQVQLLRGQKGFSDFALINQDYLEKKFSIRPDMVADFMAITGDSADNVPGVKGIGEKGASKLLQEYGSLENIYQHITDIRPVGVQKKLQEAKDDAFLSQELVTLKQDLEFAFNEEDLLWSKILQKLAANLGLFQNYSLHTVMREWQKVLTQNKVEIDSSSLLAQENADFPKVTIDSVIIKNKEQWSAIQKELLACDSIAVDTETTSTSPMRAVLVGVSLSWKSHGGSDDFAPIKSLYVPALFSENLSAQEKEDVLDDYAALPTGSEVLQQLKMVLENPRIKKIGQNIKYDLLVLRRHGIFLQGIYFDTMLASYLLFSSDMRHNLDNLALYYFGHKTITYKDLTGSGKNQLAVTQVPLDKLALYACEDSHVTFMLQKELQKKIQAENLQELYENIDMPLLEVLARMEENGIQVDKKYLADLEKQLAEKLLATEKEIYQLAKEEFNINSTKELRRVLYEKLQIKPLRKTDGGQYSTEASVLEWLKSEHPVIEKILEYRGIKKLLSTYALPLREAVDPYTQRVHTSFSQIVAATGRLASSDPNLQNIPVKDESGKMIRKAFYAQDGWSFLSLDYNQIELRILAHYSQDPSLCEAFRKGEDVHDLAALLLFHAQIFPEQTDVLFTESDFAKGSSVMRKLHEHPSYAAFRSQAKVMNFSIAYGVTDFGLAQNLSISRQEAALLIETYFNRFPKIKDYMDLQISQARENKFSENFFGRKRSLKNINAARRYDRLSAERLAINNPIQSTAADIIKLAMIDIDKKLRVQKLQSRMLLQIHDELLFECPQEELAAVQKLAKKIMENIVSLQVPLTVATAKGKTWDEAKP